MKKFWMKTMAGFIRTAVIVLFLAFGLPYIHSHLSWVPVIPIGAIVMLVFFSLGFFVTRVVLELWLMKRWAAKFEVDLAVIAYARYTLHYDLSAFVDEEVRRGNIRKAESMYNELR